MFTAHLQNLSLSVTYPQLQIELLVIYRLFIYQLHIFSTFLPHNRIHCISLARNQSIACLQLICISVFRASLVSSVGSMVPPLTGWYWVSTPGWAGPSSSCHLILVCVNYDLYGSLHINSRLHARLNNQISHPIPSQ